jgi:lysozyme
MSHSLVKKAAVELLKIDEGFKQKVYTCPAGKLTIGYGRNLEDRGVTLDEADYLLQNDVEIAYRLLDQDFSFFKELSLARKVVLVSMVFQLGYAGFKSFKKMISALHISDYKKAAFEMQSSRWYRQTPNRVKRLINAMVEG